MDRRQFLATSAAAALTLQTHPASPLPPGKPAALKLGCQSAPTTGPHLQYLARYGVRHICGYPQIAGDRLYATPEELHRMKDLAAASNIEVLCVGPPFLESSYIDREPHPAIMLARSPERDRDIESLQTYIRNCALAGIPSIKYNMSILGVLRSGTVPGRGDATCTRWSLAEAQSKAQSNAQPNAHQRSEVIIGGHDTTSGKTMPVNQPTAARTIAGHVDADAFWERITYFLDRIIPVAAEYKIRMACHPHDPGVPPAGYLGVDRVLGTVAGLKRFIEIQPSPYHGLNFCQGTISEMLADPGREIFDIIRYFGARDKIFNVRFRNIRGHRNDFTEVFPDEGDVDMVKALRVYKEVGYQYMLMPDHVPTAPTDPVGLQSFAFCYGYIRGLLQSLDTQS